MLNELGLKAAIKAALDKQSSKESNLEQIKEELAIDLAKAFSDFVKSGTVNTTIAGVSPSGPVTGTGTGTIT